MRAGPHLAIGNPAATDTPPAFLFLILGLTAAALFTVELTGPADLTRNEERLAAYVVDVLHNGHWICQHDTSGEVASKPPMFTWLAALATLPFGRLNRFSIYLPSALATFLLAVIIFRTGRNHFGWQAGFLGGMTYLVSCVADKQMNSARYDGLFALPVTLASLAAYAAWSKGNGWTRFWLFATLATFVKGPLGVLLGSTGLLAAFWEKRTGTPLRIRGTHLPGIALFLVFCGGWFALAYESIGYSLVNKLIERELVGHAVGDGSKGFVVSGFYKPSLVFISVFAPWSLWSCAGLWRIWHYPAKDAATRRFERFLFCWICVSLLIFSLGVHQRGRLIYPVIPPAAILAGREVARFLSWWNGKRIRDTATWAAACFLVLAIVYHHCLLRSSKSVQETLAMKNFAAEIRQRFGDNQELHHVDSPFALQFYLNTASAPISPQEAAKLLSGTNSVLVAIRDSAKLDNLQQQVVSWSEVARSHDPRREDLSVRILSNFQSSLGDHVLTH